jgi:hypothetical protein
MGAAAKAPPFGPHVQLTKGHGRASGRPGNDAIGLSEPRDGGVTERNVFCT